MKRMRAKLVVLVLAAAAPIAYGLGTAFTYQGRLADAGSPATGVYDLEMKLFDAASGPAQVGPTLTLDNVTVSSGLFTVSLDFGATVFDGNDRWLEIGVRPGASSGAFTAVSPRQPLTPAPNALYSLSAGAVSWTNVSGTPAGFADGQDDGLTAVVNGGGVTGAVAGSTLTLGSDATVQRRTAGSPLACATGEYLQAVGQDGSPTCVTDEAGVRWSLTGNPGTNPNLHFVGTTDFQPLHLVAGGQRALRLEWSSDSPNVIGGSSSNAVTTGVRGAFIGSGGQGGLGNQVAGNFSVVAGGLGNVAGGVGEYATVGGGQGNTASQYHATVSGGQANTASGYFSVVPGGFGNQAGGFLSFAAGQQAKVRDAVASGDGNGDEGTFVWADSSAPGNFVSTGPNQFLVRAAGGVGINKNNPTAALDVNGEIRANGEIHGTTGLTLSALALSSASGTLGTTTSAPLKFLTNNQQALRLEWALESPNVIGGNSWNSATSGVRGAFIGGGGHDGLGNQVAGNFSVVAGGLGNIAGGVGEYATVGGGQGNTASQYHATVSGGQANTASGYFSVVPGGFGNQAGGFLSFAAGSQAKVRDATGSGDSNGDEGTFVWADDSAPGSFVSTGPNQFLVRAAGGVGINKNNPAAALDVNGSAIMTGFRLTAAPAAGRVLTSDASGNGSWQTASGHDHFGQTWTGTTQTALGLSGSNTGSTWFNLGNTSAGGKQWNLISTGSGAVEGAGKLLLRNATDNRVVMTLQGTGEVGIGTTSPATPLDIGIGTYRVQFRDEGGVTPGLNLGGSGGNAGILRVRRKLEIFPNDAATSAGALDIRNTAGGATISFDGATGNASFSGTVSKAGGSFKIDHPLDPLNKYLYHSFVESPDMMNIYNGNATTDERGDAVVELPCWFEALNRDFRYQLTVIGDGVWARARVSRKIQGGRFTIQTDVPYVEVSWQVTGVRQDAFAEAHRIPVEQDKPAEERGTLLYPGAYRRP
jgi:hypothetical protein